MSKEKPWETPPFHTDLLCFVYKAKNGKFFTDTLSETVINFLREKRTIIDAILEDRDGLFQELLTDINNKLNNGGEEDLSENQLQGYLTQIKEYPKFSQEYIH
jgi:hypothetical protein